MRLGKRGTAASEMFAPDTLLFYIFFGVVLSLSAVLFVLIVSKTGAEQAKINENLESLNLMQRFLKSPECFGYNKDGVAMNNVIDADKFDNERISDCYHVTENNAPAFKITLNSDTAKIFKSIKTKNWNDNREFEEKIKPRGVLVYSENKLHNGELTIEIQNLQ